MKQPDRLRVLASTMRGRVGRCDHLNPNQGEVERREAKGKLKNYRVRVGEAASRFSLELTGFETTLASAIGAPDKICGMDRQLRLPALAPLQAFVSEDLGGEEARTWLNDPRNLSALKTLGCSRREPLHLYTNGLSLLARPARATPALLALLVDFTNLLPRPSTEVRPGQLVIEGLILDVKLLPEDLRKLVPHIKRWAVGDDVERQERLAKAKRGARAKILKEVAPLLGRIDEYLDLFGSGPLPDEAVLLGQLAEAVAELKVGEA